MKAEAKDQRLRAAARALAHAVLRDAFAQFADRLAAFGAGAGAAADDDPDLIHQARIGWRRFRSAVHLFEPVLIDAPVAQPTAARDALEPLLDAVGALRDLDVARLDTLPALAGAYCDGDVRRERHWQAMCAALDAQAGLARDAVRAQLGSTGCVDAMRSMRTWIAAIAPAETRSPAETQAPADARAKTSRARKAPPASLRRWARRRIARQHRKLKRARDERPHVRPGDAAAQAQQAHRIRILAKRERYGIEALRPLLAGRRAKKHRRRALRLQSKIGRQRDLAQAARIVGGLPVDASLAAFLRGVAAGFDSVASGRAARSVTR